MEIKVLNSMDEIDVKNNFGSVLIDETLNKQDPRCYFIYSIYNNITVDNDFYIELIENNDVMTKITIKNLNKNIKKTNEMLAKYNLPYEIGVLTKDRMEALNKVKKVFEEAGTLREDACLKVLKRLFKGK